MTVRLKELPGKVKFNISPKVEGKLFVDDELIPLEEGFYEILEQSNCLRAPYVFKVYNLDRSNW